MSNQKVTNQMTLLFSMCLELFGMVNTEFPNGQNYFNDEESDFIGKCAQRTNLEFSADDQQRLVVLAAKFFMTLDNQSPDDSQFYRHRFSSSDTKH